MHQLQSRPRQHQRVPVTPLAPAVLDLDAGYLGFNRVITNCSAPHHNWHLCSHVKDAVSFRSQTYIHHGLDLIVGAFIDRAVGKSTEDALTCDRTPLGLTLARQPSIAARRDAEILPEPAREMTLIRES
jgi:hypothetical protein